MAITVALVGVEEAAKPQLGKEKLPSSRPGAEIWKTPSMLFLTGIGHSPDP